KKKISRARPQTGRESRTGMELRWGRSSFLTSHDPDPVAQRNPAPPKPRFETLTTGLVNQFAIAPREDGIAVCQLVDYEAGRQLGFRWVARAAPLLIGERPARGRLQRLSGVSVTCGDASNDPHPRSASLIFGPRNGPLGSPGLGRCGVHLRYRYRGRRLH